MNTVPEILKNDGWTDERFSQLDNKTSSTLRSLCDTIDTLQLKIKRLETEMSMDQLKISDTITFMAVGMRYIKTPAHIFSDSDKIQLMKDDDNPKNSMAIKVMVDGEHVGFVSNDYIKNIRDIDDFENKKIEVVRNFAQSSKLKLIINASSETDVTRQYSGSGHLRIRTYPITFSEDGKAQIQGWPGNNKIEKPLISQTTQKRGTIKGLGGIQGLR